MTFSSFYGRDNKCQRCSTRQLSIQTYQVIVDALVQLPLGGTALPKLLVVVLEALPMGAKLLQTGLVDVLQPSSRTVSTLTARRVPPIGSALATSRYLMHQESVKGLRTHSARIG